MSIKPHLSVLSVKATFHDKEVDVWVVLVLLHTQSSGHLTLKIIALFLSHGKINCRVWN